MDINPEVSIVIPVYNGSNFLREAIDSALAQTYTNFEILVVDDGSTDDTWKIIQSYGDEIRGIHKANGGVASALNCGIRNMRGKYFAWLSHDDLWLPDKLEKQIHFFEVNSNYKICYSDYFVIDFSGKVLKTVETPWYPRQKAIRELFKSGYINGCTIIVEKTCFDKVGLFSEQLKYTQDNEMWIRLSREYEMGRVPEKLMNQRRHSLQGSKNISPFFSEKTSMLDDAFLSFGIDELFPECQTIREIPKKKAKAYNWFGNSMSHYRHQFDLAEKYYKKSIEIYPSWQNTARIYLLKNMFDKNFSTILKNKYFDSISKKGEQYITGHYNLYRLCRWLIRN
ncbi:MAG: glycosyltransferase family A protein [Methanoregulaceae archaeon]|jgi:hypothetical protein